MTAVKVDPTALKARMAQVEETRQKGRVVLDQAKRNFRGSIPFPKGQHSALVAYIQLRDEQERADAGLGTLDLLEKSDPDGWEEFKRKNPSVTFRLEDRSTKGFPRFVTGYESGTVFFQDVDKVTPGELMAALSEAETDDEE